MKKPWPSVWRRRGLKHSVHGDFNLFTAAEVRSAMAADGFDIKR